MIASKNYNKKIDYKTKRKLIFNNTTIKILSLITCYYLVMETPPNHTVILRSFGINTKYLEKHLISLEKFGYIEQNKKVINNKTMSRKITPTKKGIQLIKDFPEELTKLNDFKKKLTTTF